MQKVKICAFLTKYVRHRKTNDFMRKTFLHIFVTYVIIVTVQIGIEKVI